MHVFLSAEDSDPFLLDELRRAAPAANHNLVGTGLITSDLDLRPESPLLLAFARQALPGAMEAGATSINAWADRLQEAMISALPADQPWLLHVLPRYGGAGAGANRCRLIVEALRERLQKRRRHLLRRCLAAPEPFTTSTSLVQLVLTSPEQGWRSMAPAPLPQQWRALMSPFPGGHIPPASDKAAPCRAFAKLVEVEQRLGRCIVAGETCVDLGASPGSWSYVALRRGARVTAVDRAPLRDDLMRNRDLRFHQGDAFSFEPDQPVDWLLCDVIAAPERSIGLVTNWVTRRLARRFVVTIKFKGAADYPALDRLKVALPPLCSEFRLSRLCANHNEACVFGEVLITEASSRT